MIKKFISKTKKFIKEQWKIILSFISGMIGTIVILYSIQRFNRLPVTIAATKKKDEKAVGMQIRFANKMLDIIGGGYYLYSDPIALTGFINDLNELKNEVFN